MSMSGCRCSSPLLMVDIFRSLFLFVKVCSIVNDFNNRNTFSTAKVLKQVYHIITSVKLCLNSTTDTQS